MATISSISNTSLATITPSGTQEVTAGSTVKLYIETDNLSSIFVEDNNVDVTDQLVRTVKPNTGSTEQYATGYTTGGSISRGEEYAGYPVGYSAENPHTYSTNIYAPSNNTGYCEYSFDFSSIPSNATISSLTVRCCGSRESSTTDSTHMAKIGLYADSTLKSTEQEFTSTSQQIITIDSPGTWTRSELQNAKLRFTVAYYGGMLFGITWIVNYTIPGDTQYWYEYTISNVSTNHTVIVQEPYIPPEEDTAKTYYNLTISTINATTEPGTGTTRVESGTGQTITITPTDPLLTLALDNGADITSQLVQHGREIISSVTNRTTNYGFTLNQNGFYESDNKGDTANYTAAVARLDIDTPVRCLVTFTFINYAETTYDYGVFGDIDIALAASSASTDESTAKLVCNTETYNTSNEQTLTYEVSSGEHFIDIKYRKDMSQSRNNDSLQFKYTITALEPNNYYTYDLSNINEDHSLVFIFGDVTYYFVTSQLNGEGKTFPNGQMVQLPGDSYKLTIIPDNTGATVTAADNGTDVTSSLERKEIETVKDGITSTTVNYIYRLNDIQATHNISVSILSGQVLSMKISGNWVEARVVKKKIGGVWETITNYENLFDSGKIYIPKQG